MDFYVFEAKCCKFCNFTLLQERQERYNEICAKHQQCVESSNALKKKLETLRVEKVHFEFIYLQN